VGWRRLSASIPASLDDEIAAVLGAGSLGVEIVPAGAGLSAVRVYLGPADDAAAWRARAERILGAHGIAPSDGAIELAEIEDGDWVLRWQSALSPIALGARFVVLPHEGLDAPEGREAIRLVPGMAFGTGEHPTTRLCAQALEAQVAPGSRWLDLGCGTGILAIVAVFSGAVRVVALDADPEAAHVASEVVRANGLTGRIEVGTGSIGAVSGTFDGIVANIQASFFLAEAAALSAALSPAGVLAISGFLVEDIPEIEAALSAARLTLFERSSDDPWACLVARRAGS
jgi:ribosomal protein L11 methyltransferase